MGNFRTLLTLAAALIAANTAVAGPFGSKEQQRTNIDAREVATLERLWGESDTARRLYDRAYGYATFDIIKISLAFTAIGESRKTGTLGILPKRRKRSKKKSIVCTRPTAKAGTTTVPPRDTVRLMMSVNISSGGPSSWRLPPYVDSTTT